MKKQNPLGVSRSAAVLLIVGALACFVGAGMYVSDNGYADLRYLIWERSFIASAVLLTAIGFLFLEDALSASIGRNIAKIGASLYFFAAGFLVVGETLAFTLTWNKAAVLMEVYVILAYIAEMLIGWALLRSQTVAPLVAWLTILWNLGWLLALPLFGWETAGYIPLIHHFMPLIIGISLLRKTV